MLRKVIGAQIGRVARGAVRPLQNASLTRSCVVSMPAASTVTMSRRYFSDMPEPEKKTEKKAKTDKMDDPTLTPPTESSQVAEPASSNETEAQQSEADKQRIVDDLQLYQSYEGFWPRLKKSFELMEQPARDRFQRLIDDKVIVEEDFIAGGNLFVELENPLLVKYGFDPVDFLAGAKEAFLQVRKAVAVLELNDQIHCEHSLELLEEALSPPFFKVFKKVTFHEGKPKNHLVLKDLKIENTRMMSAFAEIANAEFYKYEKNSYQRFMLKALDALMMAQNADSKTWSETEKEWFDEFEMPQLYPEGSVVATVEVRFQTAEDCVEIRGTGAEAKEVESIHHKLFSMVFQSCISGQVPLNWMVHSMFVTQSKGALKAPK